MKIFTRTRKLADGDRHCLGVFPVFDQDAVTFVWVSPRDGDGFSIKSWSRDLDAGETGNGVTVETLQHIFEAGAKSAAIVYDPWSGEQLVLRLHESKLAEDFVERSVSVPMTRKAVDQAEKVYRDALLTGGHVVDVETDNAAVHLTYAAAISEKDEERPIGRWAKRATPGVLATLASLALLLIVGDRLGTVRQVAAFAVVWIAGVTAGILGSRWRS